MTFGTHFTYILKGTYTIMSHFLQTFPFFWKSICHLQYQLQLGVCMNYHHLYESWVIPQAIRIFCHLNYFKVTLIIIFANSFVCYVSVTSEPPVKSLWSYQIPQ